MNVRTTIIGPLFFSFNLFLVSYSLIFDILGKPKTCNSALAISPLVTKIAFETLMGDASDTLSNKCSSKFSIAL